MVSGLLDFFTGRSSSSGSDKTQLFKQHIVPIVHRKHYGYSIIKLDFVLDFVKENVKMY
jgi:hypothetical protein